MTTGYRIHPAADIANILDENRPDGWAMDDEITLSGLAVCESIEALIEYAAEYGMTICDGDLLVRVEGVFEGPDHDPDAFRIAASSYEVIDVSSDELTAMVAARRAGAEIDLARFG